MNIVNPEPGFIAQFLMWVIEKCENVLERLGVYKPKRVNLGMSEEEYIALMKEKGFHFEREPQ